MKLIIPLKNGDAWEVEAEIVGDLAVHPARKGKNKWSVTHVPTLLSLNEVVPSKLMTGKAKLLAWCNSVQEGIPRDWLAMRKFTASYIKSDPEYTAKLRERIRNHCLSMEK